MGAKLCCMSLSTSDFDEYPTGAATEGHQQKPPPSGSMLNCIIGPSHMKKVDEEEEEKRREHGEWLPPEMKAMEMCKLATLEEWLSSSPGKKPEDYISGGGHSGELHVFKQPSKVNKFRPSSSSRVHAELISTASPSDSKASVERINVGDHNYNPGDRGGGERGEASSEAGSRSGRSGRRVKFRWPEADIFTFYSPEGAYKEINKQPPP